MFCLHNCLLLFQVFHMEYLQRAFLKATTSSKKYSLISILLWLHALHNTTLWICTRQYMHVCIIQLYVNLLHFCSRSMNTHPHTCTHTHMHTHTHTHANTHIQTCKNTHNRHMHTHMHTKVYWHMSCECWVRS